MTMAIPAFDYSRFGAVLFDVDGTLYDQKRLRRFMMVELLAHCLSRPSGLCDLRILSNFRRQREKKFQREELCLAVAQYQWTAEALNIDAERVQRIVKEWILDRPLQHLPACRPPGMLELFERLARKKVKIGVFSDYPPDDKLAALGLKADASACALDLSINRFKPHPAGLIHICKKLDISPEQVLHIGDRKDRDELAAKNCGAQSIIMPASCAVKLGRKNTYDKLFPD